MPEMTTIEVPDLSSLPPGMVTALLP